MMNEIKDLINSAKKLNEMKESIKSNELINSSKKVNKNGEEVINNDNNLLKKSLRKNYQNIKSKSMSLNYKNESFKNNLNQPLGQYFDLKKKEYNNDKYIIIIQII